MLKKGSTAAKVGRKRTEREVNSDQNPVQAWMESTVEESNLKNLVNQGLLPPEHLDLWKSTKDSDVATENTCGTIVYTSFIERGLCLPASQFLCELLCFYKIHLVHLNPNGISQISIFVHLCEAFLGIKPNLDLFRYFFHLIPNNNGATKVCGGVVLKLRQISNKPYFVFKLKDPGRNWPAGCFIIRDVMHKLPTVHAPVPNDNWNCHPEETPKILELVKKIEKLKDEGLTAAGIAYSFTKRRIQPLQERQVPGYYYEGPLDPTRLKKEDLTHDEILARVGIFFEGIKSVPDTPPEYCKDNPPPDDHITSFSSPYPYQEDLTNDQMENRADLPSGGCHSKNIQAAAVGEEESNASVDSPSHFTEFVEFSNKAELEENAAELSSGSKRPSQEVLQPPASKKPTSELSADVLLSESMQIAAPIQNLQGPSAGDFPGATEATLMEQVHVEDEDKLLTSVMESKKGFDDQLKILLEKCKRELAQNKELLIKNKQLLFQAQSVEAKLAEEQVRSANLQEQVVSLKGEISASEEDINKLKTQLAEALEKVKGVETELESQKIRLNDLQKAETENKEIKVAVREILKSVAVCSKDLTSDPSVDQLRKVPVAVQTYLRESCRYCISMSMALVKESYPDLDLTQVGKVCSTQKLSAYVIELKPEIDRLLPKFKMVEESQPPEAAVKTN